MRLAHALLLLPLLFALRPAPGLAAPPPSKPPPSKPATPRPVPLLMAHYLPWFRADPAHGRWGWHWTMNHFHPDVVTGGRREAASHFYPLMGLYDSQDPDAAECHALLMKLSGIGGVLIDWYGTDEYLDYGNNHRGALAMVQAARKAGLRFAVVYEDQTVPHLIEGHVLAETEAVAHGRRLLAWADAHWFSDPAYLTLGGRPVFLVFGGVYYTGDQWRQIFAGLPRPPLYFTEEERRAPADGAFAWPQVAGGTAGSVASLERFYAHAKDWPWAIPAAWPRFRDIYAEAGVQKSWGRIEDRGGRTYAETLARALDSGAPAVQLVTWNDWGEGTVLEPSAEFGYRDLEATQRAVRARDPSFPYTPADLRLPPALYALQKRRGADPRMRARLAAVSRLLFAGHTARARALLAGLGRPG
jgi:hypothetical protein